MVEGDASNPQAISDSDISKALDGLEMCIRDSTLRYSSQYYFAEEVKERAIYVGYGRERRCETCG